MIDRTSKMRGKFVSPHANAVAIHDGAVFATADTVSFCTGFPDKKTARRRLIKKPARKLASM